MQEETAANSKIRRRVNDLVMAEVFLIQATLESATALGDGFSTLSNKLFNEEDDTTGESVQDALQRIKDEALEPYSARYRYFRQMVADQTQHN